MNAELLFQDNFCRRAFGIADTGAETSPQAAPRAPRSNGCECRVIRMATARVGTFAITINGKATVGVIVGVDLERGATGANNRGGMSWAIN